MDSSPMTKYRPMELPDVPCDGDMRTFLATITKTDGTPAFPDAKPHPYSEIQADRIAEWQKIVDLYEANPCDYVAAWWYLDCHPAFWQFMKEDATAAERIHERNLMEDGGVRRCVDISVAKVNPITNRVEDDEALNTKNEVWIELGKWPWPTDAENANTRVPYHDYELDCGGPTFEAAIVRAAHNVATVYGHDRKVCDGEYPRPDFPLPEDAFTDLVGQLEARDVLNDPGIAALTLRLGEAIERANPLKD